MLLTTGIMTGTRDFHRSKHCPLSSSLWYSEVFRTSLQDFWKGEKFLLWFRLSAPFLGIFSTGQVGLHERMSGLCRNRTNNVSDKHRRVLSYFPAFVHCTRFHAKGNNTGEKQMRNCLFMGAIWPALSHLVVTSKEGCILKRK